MCGNKLPGYGCLLGGLGPVLQKLVEPFAGQRVIELHIRDLKWQAADLRSRQLISQFNTRGVCFSLPSSLGLGKLKHTLRLYDAAMQGGDGGLGPVADVQAAEHNVHMPLHGAFRDAQVLGDLFVAQTFYD